MEMRSCQDSDHRRTNAVLTALETSFCMATYFSRSPFFRVCSQEAAVLCGTNMLSRTFFIACMAAQAAAFMPGCTGPIAAPSLRSSATSAMSRFTMINEDRMDGFGGGKDAIKKVVESRVKTDWGEQGTGGAKGQTYKGPSSFEEYLKKRAAEEGGKVTDLAGNDISDVKPSYEIAEGTWGPPPEAKEESVFDWIDRSANVDTKGVMSEEQEEWRRKKEEERAAEADAVEARMQKWMAEAAAKKAAGGQ